METRQYDTSLTVGGRNIRFLVRFICKGRRRLTYEKSSRRTLRHEKEEKTVGCRDPGQTTCYGI